MLGKRGVTLLRIGGGVKTVASVARKQVEGIILLSLGITKDADPNLGEGDQNNVVGKVTGGEGVSKEASVDSVGGVKVGEVPLSFDKGVRKGIEGVKRKEVAGFLPRNQLNVMGQSSIQKLIRKYSSCVEDLQCARKGVMATVNNGESIPIVQKRILDAGVEDVEIIPVGANRVFICSLTEVNISTILNDAKDFFAHFFINFVPWDKKAMSFQRGAWYSDTCLE